MGAVVAHTGSIKSWRRIGDFEPRRGFRTHWAGVGRVEHERRAAARVSSRNDYDVADRTGQALVDATVYRVGASNLVKPERGSGRKSKGRGRSVTATSPDRQPRGAFRPGVWSF